MEKKSFEFIMLESGMLFDCITPTANVAVLLRKWGLRERFNHIHEMHAKKNGANGIQEEEKNEKEALLHLRRYRRDAFRC